MILRRITEHVKAQNWFAVGIDFVIVVVIAFLPLANTPACSTNRISDVLVFEKHSSRLAHTVGE